MKRGMTKTEADSELAELKQLCLDYLRVEEAEKGVRQTNAKQKALVMKEQGQVIRGDSLETLKQKDGSNPEPRKKKKQNNGAVGHYKGHCCNQPAKISASTDKNKWGSF